MMRRDTPAPRHGMTWHYFRFCNFGATDRWPIGWRYAFALIGRRQVRIMDWSNGLKARVPLATWRAMAPVRIAPPRRRLLKQRRRATTNRKNRTTWREVMASLRAVDQSDDPDGDDHAQEHQLSPRHAPQLHNHGHD